MNAFETFPIWLLQKWQETADLLAESIDVPAALIMRHEDEFMEVFTSSRTELNPYSAGARDEWYGLYCQTVIQSQEKLMIPNALKSEKWKNNPDIKLGMIAYLGFPLNYPDKKPFGTLCVLDNKERFFTHQDEKLIRFYRDNIELDLFLIEELERKAKELKANIKRETEIRIDVEKQLKVNEELYQLIAENTADTIWVLNPLTKKFSYISPSVEKLLGYSQVDSVQLSIEDMFTPESCIQVNANISNRLAEFLGSREQKSFIDEYQLIRKDGTVIFVETNAKFFFNQHDDIEIIGITRDITERKKAEEIIKQSELRFRLFTDYSPLAIYMSTGSEQNAEYINPTYTKLFGYTLEEVPNAEILWSRAYPDVEYRKKIREEWDRKVALANETFTEIEPIETIVTCKDGSKKHISWGYISTDKQNWTFGLDITNQKNAAENIREIGNNYFNLFNSIKQAIYIQNPDMTFINVNQGAIDMYGYEREFFVGKTPETLSAPGRNDITEITRLVNLAYIGQPQRFEFWGIKKDGTIFPKDVWTVKGKYFGKDVLITIGEDITDRKKAEIALKESEEQNRAIIDAVPDLIFQLNRDGVFLNYHSTELSKLALPPHEFLGKNIKDVMPSDISMKAMSAMEEAFRTDSVVIFEYTLTTNGVERCFENRISTMSNKDSIFLIRDITERKQAEISLKQSEEQNRAILDAVPDLLFHLNKEGVYLDYHTSEHNKYLVPPEKFLGQKIIDVLPSDMASKAMSAIKEALQTSSMVMYEYHIDSKDGKREYFENRIVPMSNNELISVIRDITERKLAENELLKSKEEIMKFAYHIQNVREEEKLDIAREIHDSLGQLLVALKIDMGMLKKKMAIADENIQTEEILMEVDKIFTLVDNSLKSSRRIINGLRPELLEQLGFEGAVKDYLHESEVRNHFNCDFICEIPNLKLDYKQELALFRIVQEALNNITKYAKATTVTVKLEEDKEKMVLEITDNGVGFDITKKGRNDSYGFMGMRERAILLDGNLVISSEIGKGTSIRVEIPIGLKTEKQE